MTPPGAREVVEVQWREVTTTAALVEATTPSVLWLGPAVDPLPKTALLFPELADDEIRLHHFFEPQGRVRLGLGSVPEAIVSGRSLVGSPSELYRLGPMTQWYVDTWLGDNLPVGDRELADKTERRLPGVSVLLTHWNCATYGHWLLEGVPKLLLLRRLADGLPAFRILLPRSASRFVVDWIGLVLPTARIEVYEDDIEFIRAETLIVPAVLSVSRGHHFHPEMLNLLDDLAPAAPRRDPARIYVTRVEPSDYRQMANQAEIESIAVAEGLEVVAPETLPISDQIALFARATVIVGEFGSAMHNTLFSPPGALVLCLNWITGLQSRIAELKRHHVGYLIPNDGVTVDIRPPLQTYHIDPHRFRTHLRAVLELDRSGADPASWRAPDDAVPRLQAAVATTPAEATGSRAPRGGRSRAATTLQRGAKLLWWTVTLQLPRRVRAYRAYRSAVRDDRIRRE